MLIFRFFHYIWFTDSENLFHSYFERKNDKVLTFNIVYFPNFEISATPQVQNLISVVGCLLEEIWFLLRKVFRSDQFPQSI